MDLLVGLSARCLSTATGSGGFVDGTGFRFRRPDSSVPMKLITRASTSYRLSASLRSSRTLPEEHRDIATHQRAALDYGIASHRFMLGWFRDHIDRQEPPNR